MGSTHGSRRSIRAGCDWLSRAACWPGSPCGRVIARVLAATADRRPEFRRHDSFVRDEDLLALVEQGKLDELYEAVNPDDVADAWLAHLREPTEVGKDRFWWAVELLVEDPDVHRRRSTILSLIKKARDDDELGAVAAGPLEAYLSGDESTLRWAENQARASERFRRALRGVNVWDLPDRAFARLEAAAGAELGHPDRVAYERRTGGA